MRRTAAVLATVAVLGATTIAAPKPAEAHLGGHWGGPGLAFGLVAGALTAGAIAASSPYYYGPGYYPGDYYGPSYYYAPAPVYWRRPYAYYRGPYYRHVYYHHHYRHWHHHWHR